jgi:hypothetical protein
MLTPPLLPHLLAAAGKRVVVISHVGALHSLHRAAPGLRSVAFSEQLPVLIMDISLC